MLSLKHEKLQALLEFEHATYMFAARHDFFYQKHVNSKLPTWTARRQLFLAGGPYYLVQESVHIDALVVRSALREKKERRHFSLPRELSGTEFYKSQLSVAGGPYQVVQEFVPTNPHLMRLAGVK